jgi:hypothetical protein
MCTVSFLRQLTQNPTISGTIKEQPSHALICYKGDDPAGMGNRFAIQSREHGVLYIDESCGEGEDNPAEHLEWQFHQDCIK